MSAIKAAMEAVGKSLGVEPCVFEAEQNRFIASPTVFFEMLSFGNNTVMVGDPLLVDWLKERYLNMDAGQIMDGPELYMIERKMRQFGKRLCGEHLHYMRLHGAPDIQAPKGYDFCVFEQDEMPALYEEKGFENALNYKNDVLAVAAYREQKIAALAGADDCLGKLWQIGVDTLPQHRGRGLATYLTHKIAGEIEKRGMYPYYTTWGANIASNRAAIAAGFAPVWTGDFAKDAY